MTKIHKLFIFAPAVTRHVASHQHGRSFLEEAVYVRAFLNE